MMTNDAAGRLQKRELFNYLSGDRYVTVIFLNFLFLKFELLQVECKNDHFSMLWQEIDMPR